MYPLFETIKVLDGIPQHTEWHQKRMEKSILTFYKRRKLFCLKDELNIPDDYNNGVFKCRLDYNELHFIAEFSEYFIRKIASLKLLDANHIDYSMKYTDRVVLTHILEQRGDCDDVLLVKNGLITDSSYTNIVLFDGSNWFTPLHPLLEGTQRNRLLSENMIKAMDIRPQDLKDFKSFKLINAMRGFEEVEEHSVNNIFA